MKKGQAVLSVVALLPVMVLTILITFWVYGGVSNIVPHDQTYLNESMCTSCSHSTLYEFDNYPILNDSTLVCSNATGNQAMTNGVNNEICLGYNVVQRRYINLTNTSAQCSLSNVRCDYTYDWANANEQGFWDTSTSNINSGYTLGSVVPIVFAAVVIIGIVFLLGKRT